MARSRSIAGVIAVGAFLFALTQATVGVAQDAGMRLRVNRLERDAQGVLRRMLVRELEAAGVEVADDAPSELDGVRRRGRLSLRLRTNGETQTLQASSSSLRTLARRGARAVVRALRDVPPPATEIVAEEEEEEEEEGEEEEEEEGEGAASVVEEDNEEEEAPRQATRDDDAAPRRAPRGDRHAPRRSRDAAPAPALRSEGYDRARSILVIYGGAGSTYRRLAFRDDLFGAVSSYRLPAALGLRASGTWFPLLHGEIDSPLAWLGFGGAYRRVVGLESEGPNGERLPTRSHAWNVDLWWRVPHRSHDLAVLGGYGEESFRVDAAGPLAPGSPEPPAVPVMRYRYARLGGDAYVHLAGGFFLGVSAGFRAIVDTGSLDVWFPRRRAIGFDGGLRLALQLADVLVVRLSVEYERYSFVLRPRPGDQIVVGGASDDWLHASVDFGVRLPEMR